MVSSSIHRPVKLSILIKAANLLLLVLVFAFPACKDPSKADPPSSLVPKEKMIKILVDVHIMEAYAEDTRVNKDSLQPELKVAYEEIYKKHQVTSAEFRETFSWYEGHPEKLDAIYQDVVAELSKQEARAKSKQGVPAAVEEPATDTANANKLKVFGR